MRFFAPLARLGAGFKAAVTRRTRRFSGYGGSGNGLWSWLWGTLPGSQTDWVKEAGTLWLNSAVSICLGWIADNLPEPELQVYRTSADGTREPIPGHPLPALVDNPNPYYDGDTLWQATAVSYGADGNAYWLIARDAAGRGVPRELYWVPHWQIEPRWPDDGSDFISHYVYRPDGEEIVLQRSDVVHFRFGMDPHNPRLGMSRLKAVLREICSDNAAATYTAALLKNMGVPGVVISPASPDGKITKEQSDLLKEQWRERVAGENRGKPFIAGGSIKVDQLSLSPEQLALDKIRSVPEARIAGALRIPPIVVGFNVGLERSTFSNYAQARRAAYEDCLMPMGRRFARTLDRQLLPYFKRWNDRGDAAAPGETTPKAPVAPPSCGWDYTRVSALAEDLTERFKRAVLAYRGGVTKRSESRAMIDLESDDADDVYFEASSGKDPAKELGAGEGTGGQAA